MRNVLGRFVRLVFFNDEGTDVKVSRAVMAGVGSLDFLFQNLGVYGSFFLS